MKKVSLLIIMIFFVGFLTGQNTANITISISGIELNNSKLFVGLYDNEAAFKLKSNAVDSIMLIPDKETIKVVLKNISYGNYAIAIFQDINNNNKLDSRKFKIPTEPVGISNYSDNSSYLPPKFKKAQFSVIGDTLVFISLICRK